MNFVYSNIDGEAMISRFQQRKTFKSKYVKRKAIEPEANDDSDEISAQRVCA